MANTRYITPSDQAWTRFSLRLGERLQAHPDAFGQGVQPAQMNLNAVDIGWKARMDVLANRNAGTIQLFRRSKQVVSNSAKSLGSSFHDGAHRFFVFGGVQKCHSYSDFHSSFDGLPAFSRRAAAI